MSEARKCDRCKKFYEGLTNSIQYRKYRGGWSDTEDDLCDSCYEAFLKFMNMGKKPKV
jgi:hypothetical protein